MHKYGHNIPRLTGADLEKFGQFIEKVAFECLGTEVKIEAEVYTEDIKEWFKWDTTGHGFLLNKL